MKKILKRIEEIKKEISLLGEMRTGSLTKQYNVCGNPTCRCKDKKSPQKHGPYYQLSFTRYGKSTSEFVKKEDVKDLIRHVKNYKRFMNLKDEWIDLSIQIARLRKTIDL